MQTEASFWRVLWEMVWDIRAVAMGPEKEALNIALWLAFFNQAMASSAIINYAPTMLEEAGVYNRTAATLLTSTVTAAKACPSLCCLQPLPHGLWNLFSSLEKGRRCGCGCRSVEWLWG